MANPTNSTPPSATAPVEIITFSGHNYQATLENGVFKLATAAIAIAPVVGEHLRCKNSDWLIKSVKTAKGITVIEAEKVV